MTTTVLSNLQQVETELAAQEEAIEAQLQEVRNKLNGIRAVLPMFDEASGSIQATSSTTVKATKAPTAKATTAKASTPKTKAKQASSGTTPKAKKSKKSESKKKKKDGRAAAWQKYTRPGVKNESIPDAVKLILETQPTKSFKIAEVMDALFKENMPKAQYLKARNRISNVLSGGVRAGDWYRGERSSYSMTAS
ncbi:MAG: hypothetical protein AAF810_08725 [Cyanobacteria bacterium P01_D01_bin.36]